MCTRARSRQPSMVLMLLWSMLTNSTIQEVLLWTSKVLRVRLILTPMLLRQTIDRTKYASPTVFQALILRFSNSNSTSSFTALRFLKHEWIKLPISRRNSQLPLKARASHQCRQSFFSASLTTLDFSSWWQPWPSRSYCNHLSTRVSYQSRPISQLLTCRWTRARSQSIVRR